MDKGEERSMPLIGVYLYNRELTTEITFGFAVWRRGRQQYISSVALPACINVDIGSSFRPFPNRRPTELTQVGMNTCNTNAPFLPTHTNTCL